jgi:hypothetical protein
MATRLHQFPRFGRAPEQESESRAAEPRREAVRGKTWAHLGSNQSRPLAALANIDTQFEALAGQILVSGEWLDSLSTTLRDFRCGQDVDGMAENDRRRREDAARKLWDELAVNTEHRDITKVQAFREMCEATVKVYDGTEDQRVADWARDALRLLDEGA